MALRLRTAVPLALLASLASPALAQEAETLPPPEEATGGFTIAAGGAYKTDYEGSDDYHLIPALAIRGEVLGVGVVTRGTYLYVDFFPRTAKNFDFDVGPIVGFRANRSGNVKDDVVDLLPELKTAIEVGAFAGVSFHDITNPYDSLSLRLDVVHDVGNAHESTVFGPEVSFSTPLSRHTYVSASVGAEFVGDKYADYYFSISPADTIASGLATFDADGGMKNWEVGMLINQSITGDLTGGLSIFGTANYSRLVGDFKDSPIVSVRGSPNQWLLAAGLAYTF
jgi:MipA family protein